MKTLGERQFGYEAAYDGTIIARLPIIVRINLNNYKKLSKALKNSFASELFEVMLQTTLYSLNQVQDAVFGYCHSDEISIILKNDKELDYEPWCRNFIQEINSLFSSYCTNGFIKSNNLLGGLDLIVDPTFKAKVWAVPNITEAANYIISRQGNCLKNAINIVCYNEFGKLWGKERAFEFLKNKSYDKKRVELLENCDVDLFEQFPLWFLNGGAVYKIPIINNDKTKYKWYVDAEVPSFLQENNFIYTILNNGSDIFRPADIA